MRILVIGATGYVGGRLVPRLLEEGHHVRAAARNVAHMRDRPWANQAELVSLDLLDAASIEEALPGIDVAYYLVHSMSSGADFMKRDQEAANNFVAAAKETGDDLKHVIYLGGLQPQAGARRSAHLESRAAVGRILRDELPTTEFRAGPIVGSGSASFEMIRYLTERLPIMVTPKWVKNRAQPIGMRNVRQYLIAACGREPMGIVEIGADRLTFEAMMQTYAEVRGLRRRIIIPTPVLAPELAARWCGLVTPISNRIARPLVKGMVASTLADTTKARACFPEIEPMPYRRAVELALQRVEEHLVETRWSGAGDHTAGANKLELADEQGLMRESRRIEVAAPQRPVFDAFASLGGDKGWHVWRWAWAMRGVFDQLIGGPGLRRGRRHPHELLEGEAVDFWRVERVDRPRLLRLRAEMKVPGRAWLQFEAEPIDDTRSMLIQTALFEPKGLAGFLYWWALYPMHRWIFSDLVKAVGKDAERSASVTPAAPAPTQQA